MPTLDPDSNILIDTEWLAEHLDDPQIRMVDCDEPLGYDRMHITGAMKIPVFHYIKNTSVVSPAGYGVNVMTAEEVSALLHGMGIGPNDKVVAYDNSFSLYAARFWWVLTYYGYKFVKIMDGGWKKWYREGRPIGLDVQKYSAQDKLKPKVDTSMIIGTDELIQSYNYSDVVVWDVRSQNEYIGTETRGNQRTGHIPGAVHMEWKDTIDKATGCFVDGKTLKNLLTNKGITPDKKIITHCQGGIRAAHAALTLQLLGYENVRNYDPSWNDWGNRLDTPIEI